VCAERHRGFESPPIRGLFCFDRQKSLAFLPLLRIKRRLLQILHMKNKISLLLTASIVCAVCAPALTQAQYQTQNNNYGVSGGNVNDATRSFCCSGTLGSLVKDSSNVLYILSNNHVLARQDQASVGEDISQPGLIDNGCRIPPIVADFTSAVHLGNNVDCAIAQLRAGTMNTAGAIQGLNGSNSGVQPSTTALNGAVGMAVQKSGRTTGHTTGTIGSVNTSVNVQYQKNCGSGKKTTISYQGQYVINSSSFSAGGDSGSLILTNTSCAHPVALLFAGSSSDTIGNPINEVMAKMSTALGRTLSFVGTNCTGPASPQFGAQSFQLPQQALDRANTVLDQNRQDLMSRPGVIGVGLGALEDNSAPAVVVYVDKTSQVKPQVADQIDNVPVRIIMTDPFIAY